MLSRWLPLQKRFWTVGMDLRRHKGAVREDACWKWSLWWTGGCIYEGVLTEQQAVRSGDSLWGKAFSNLSAGLRGSYLLLKTFVLSAAAIVLPPALRLRLRCKFRALVEENFLRSGSAGQDRACQNCPRGRCLNQFPMKNLFHWPLHLYSWTRKRPNSELLA
jgi:hypothetical protein